jgi:hypothetical protein
VPGLAREQQLLAEHGKGLAACHYACHINRMQVCEAHLEDFMILLRYVALDGGHAAALLVAVSVQLQLLELLQQHVLLWRAGVKVRHLMYVVPGRF